MGTKPRANVIMIVDQSGSMSEHQDVVREGLNEYVRTLRADKAISYRVTVALFNDSWELVCKNAKPKDVPAFEDVYFPQGMTALNYGIGKTLTEFDDTWAEREDGTPGDKHILVVQTDGLENYSHLYHDPASPANDPRPLYDAAKIKAMIAEREDERGWVCLYLGAGPTAWRGGREFRHRVETQSTATSHANTYSGLSTYTKNVSRGMEPQTAVDFLEVEANAGE